MTPATTSGCAALATIESSTYDNNFRVLAFDQSTAETAWGTFLLPDDWDDGTEIKARLFFYSAATGAVKWTIAGRGNLQTYDTNPFPGASVVDSVTGAGALNTTDAIGPIPFVDIPSVAITGRTVSFLVRRDAADGSDTSAGDASLISVSFQIYTTGLAAAW
jgi:hypothetical protein